jgi:Na+/proline symporter
MLMLTLAAAGTTVENAGTLSGHFKALDWIVLVGYLALTTALGIGLAGKQKSMQDFFRGGDKLPWYAVSGSMIATIISAVTFIGVPAIVYRETGNFTYLQFGIIAGLLSRLFVAFVLVPAYYKNRVYSPYDYMGNQLGESARTVTTAMFSLMGLLAQAARVYLTAIILELVLHDQLTALEAATGISPLVASVTLVGIIAIAWTLFGGIATVVWTDVMLFLVFVVGGVTALLVVAHHLPGGIGQIISEGWEANKFQLWRLSEEGTPGPGWMTTFTSPYTLVAAFIAVTFGNIGAYGTDQLLAQRIFCCKSKGAAQLAVISSWAAEAVVALMLLVGVGLWAYYNANPDALVGDAAAKVSENADNIFPVFILTIVPPGLTGLIVAGIFAAAISSLTSILAALSQTSMSAVYLPLRKIDPDNPDHGKHSKEVLLASRLLIVFWGIGLCVMAFGIDWYVTEMQSRGKDVPFLDLALGLASYVIGALLATFLLAWLPVKKNAYGLIWAAPLSVLMVWAARFHDAAAPAGMSEYVKGMWTDHLFLTVCLIVSVVFIGSWVLSALASGKHMAGNLAKTPWLVIGCALLIAVSVWGWFPTFAEDGTQLFNAETGAAVKRVIAWPWYAVIGGATAFIFGYLLGGYRAPDAPGRS